MEQPAGKSGLLNQKILIIGGVAGAGVVGLIILLVVIFAGSGDAPKPILQASDQNTPAPVLQEQFSENTQSLISELKDLIKLTEKPEEDVKMADLDEEVLVLASEVPEETLKKIAKRLPKAQADALKDLCNNAKITVQSKEIIEALESDEDKVPTIQEIGTLKKAEELGCTEVTEQIQEVIEKAVTKLNVPYKELTLFLARPDACLGKLGDVETLFKEVEKDEKKAKELPEEVQPALKRLKKQVSSKAQALKFVEGKEKPKSVKALEELVFMSPELGLKKTEVKALEERIQTLKSKLEKEKKKGDEADDEEEPSSSSEEKSEDKPIVPKPLDKKPAEKPTNKPAEKPDEKPTNKPAQKPPVKPEVTKPRKPLEQKQSPQQTGDEPNQQEQQGHEERKSDSDDDNEPNEPEKPTVAKEHIEKFKKAMEDLRAPGYDFKKLNANFKTAVDAYLAEVKKTRPAPSSETNNVSVSSEIGAQNYVYSVLNPFENFAAAIGNSAITADKIREGNFKSFHEVSAAYRKDAKDGKNANKGPKVYDAALRYFDYFLIKGENAALSSREKLPILKLCEEFLVVLRPLCGTEDDVFFDKIYSNQNGACEFFDSNDLFVVIHLIIKTYVKQTDRKKSITYLEEYQKEVQKKEKNFEIELMLELIQAALSALKAHDKIIEMGVKGWDMQKFVTSLNVKDVTDACKAAKNPGECKLLVEKTKEYFDKLSAIFKELREEWFDQEKKKNVYTALKAAVEKYFQARIMMLKYELALLAPTSKKGNLMAEIEAFDKNQDYLKDIKELAQDKGHEQLFALIKNYFEACYQHLLYYNGAALKHATDAVVQMNTIVSRYPFEFFKLLKELETLYNKNFLFGFKNQCDLFKNAVNVCMMILAAEPKLFNAGTADDLKRTAAKYVWIDIVANNDKLVKLDKSKISAAFGKFYTALMKQNDYPKKVFQRNFLTACQSEKKTKDKTVRFFTLKPDGTLNTKDFHEGLDATANLTKLIQEVIDEMNAYVVAKGLKPAAGGKPANDFENLNPKDLPTPYDKLCEDIEKLEKEGGAIKALYDQSVADLQ